MKPVNYFLACAGTLAAVLSVVAPTTVHADYTVYVGYADTVSPNPNFPNPYFNATVFNGIKTVRQDSGAIRIHNTGKSNLIINDLTVTLNPSAGPVLFALWGFGKSGITLKPGQDAVFANTGYMNFDTSDYGVLGGAAGTPAPLNNNCSIGPTALTPVCINNAPVVSVVVDGVQTDYHDTGHVLDTGGYDLWASNPCPTATDTSGNCNESLQWRPIGTTGVQTVAFGGTQLGMTLSKVVCTNTTTKQSVTVPLSKGSPTWDCVAAGLKVKSNDVVTETLTGTSN